MEGVGGDDFGDDDDTDESVVVVAVVLLVMVVVDTKPSRAFLSMFAEMTSWSVLDSSSLSRIRSLSRSRSLSSGGDSKGLLGGLPTTFQLSSAVSGCWFVALF